MITSSITLTKDLVKDKTDRLGTQNDLSDIATNLIRSYEDMIGEANAGIFRSHGNASALATIIQEGQVLGTKGDYTDTLNKAPDAKTVSNNMELVLRAAMLP
jgi:hypothetical protein